MWQYFISTPNTHSLSCQEGITYSQALPYNMIISEDHILLEALNNLTHILLAHIYPLHLTYIHYISCISTTPHVYPPHLIPHISTTSHHQKHKKALMYTHSNLLSQRTPHTKPNILYFKYSDMGNPFSDMGKSFTNTIHQNLHS